MRAMFKATIKNQNESKNRRLDGTPLLREKQQWQKPISNPILYEKPATVSFKKLTAHEKKEAKALAYFHYYGLEKTIQNLAMTTKDNPLAQSSNLAEQIETLESSLREMKQLLFKSDENNDKYQQLLFKLVESNKKTYTNKK